MDDLKALVGELVQLNDDNLARAVVDSNDVQLCLSELWDMLNTDFVPVVRCKKCKHYRYYGKTSLLINGKNVKAGWCKRRIRYDEECRMLPDDFCSYGEAR